MRCNTNTNCVTDLALSDKWDIARTDDNGITDIALAHNHRVVGQMVRSRLIHVSGENEYEDDLTIDWYLFMRNSLVRPLLGAQIRALVGDTDGVDSVSLASSEFEVVDREMQVRGICFTSDCCNSRAEQDITI